MLLSLGLQFKDKTFGLKNIIRDKLEMTEKRSKCVTNGIEHFLS